jgi:hypothetical protein
MSIVTNNGYTCDGSADVPTKVPPRVVGGFTLDADGAVTRGEGFVLGLDNGTYRGILTPGLVTFLKNKTGITTYANVNVIGNEPEWNGENKTLLTFKNSGIKGTYQNMLQSNFAGIIDIDVNRNIKNLSASDVKLNLYGAPTNSIEFARFKVVDVTAVTGNWNNVGNTGDPYLYTPLSS